MEDVLALQLNIFLMIALGVLVRKIRLVSKEGEKSITNLVIYLVLPCNIVMSFLSEGSQGLGTDCLVIVLLSIGIQALAVLYGKLFFRRETPDRRKNLAFGMICSNAGFLGNPVAEGVFGATGLMLASLYLIPQRVMMWSNGMAIYSGDPDVKNTLKKVVTHPCVIACFLGLGLLLTGWRPPDLVLAPVQMLARCNTPLSMLVIGMILSEINLRTMVDKTILRFTLHRLVGMPLVVYLACLLLPVSKVVAGVSVLLAAMPAGATTTILAAKYDRDPLFATKLVIFTTLLSLPAIFVWSMVMKAF